MLSDEWLSRYGPLENFNASVTRTRTGTGTWTTGVTAIALCTSCNRAKNYIPIGINAGGKMSTKYQLTTPNFSITLWFGLVWVWHNIPVNNFSGMYRLSHCFLGIEQSTINHIFKIKFSDRIIFIFGIFQLKFSIYIFKEHKILANIF